MAAKLYLLVVGIIYLLLALWCVIQPAVTSAKIGFELQGGTGQSEFMTVYGGLEFGLALLLIVFAFKSETVRYGVIACLLVHGSLVVFRTGSFFCFSDISPFTYQLAIGEWGITLVGFAVLYFLPRETAKLNG